MEERSNRAAYMMKQKDQKEEKGACSITYMCFKKVGERRRRMLMTFVSGCNSLACA
jgi:hypothetical protein